MSTTTTPVPMPRRRPRAYLRSGLYARPALPSPDTDVGRVLAERRVGLVADLGGEEALTMAQRGLIDVALRTWAILDSVDAYLLYLPSPVDRRHRRCWGVVLDRTRLAAQLETTLARLGLERRAKPVQTLAELIAAEAAARRR